jgi:hypothetical protein
MSIEKHEGCVHTLIAQMVAGEPAGTREQPPLVRLVERMMRGDRTDAGEAHRWMYDCFTLRALVESVGFSDIRFESAAGSRVEGWEGFGLDREKDGSPYKPHSLYVEAVK